MLTTAVANAPTYALVGDIYALLVTGQDSGGAFSLMHGFVAPGGGPPLHTHSREVETFYILDGTITFWHADDEPVHLGPGSVIQLEPHVRHRFQNTSDTTARMLVHTAPAGFENMIIEAGTPVPTGTNTLVPPSEDELAKIGPACERAGIVLHL